jgi:hypothetical protein
MSGDRGGRARPGRTSFGRSASSSSARRQLLRRTAEVGKIQIVFSRDRQIEFPHQGQDRVVVLATMDTANAAVVIAPRNDAEPFLISRPQSGGRQFKHVPIGIAEINAFAAAWPFHPALDRNAGLGKLGFPIRQRVGPNREGDVNRAVTIMRRHRAAGQM